MGAPGGIHSVQHYKGVSGVVRTERYQYPQFAEPKEAASRENKKTSYSSVESDARGGRPHVSGPLRHKVDHRKLYRQW